jgi:hypothetical protein
MAKSGVSRRPKGRSPVIAVRVPPPLHEEIKTSAAAAEHTMSEEMQQLLRSALENRKRFPSSTVAQTVEMATFALLLTGERYAEINDVNKPWWEDLESRRSATVAACVALITNFVSTSADDQALTVEAIKGRIWTHIVRPKNPFVDPEDLQ